MVVVVVMAVAESQQLHCHHLHYRLTAVTTSLTMAAVEETSLLTKK